MPAVQPACGCKRLLAVTEHEREHGRKGAVKAAEGISQGGGVLGDTSGDPGMRELEQESASGTQKEGSLSVDLPKDGAWAKHALPLASRGCAHLLQLSLEVSGSYISDHRRLG
jgi:hypothetical protein